MAAALVAFFLNALTLRDGIGISPDGWIYWQSSVSLLHGFGYRIFLHSAPVREWPPLYPIFLAFWQLLFGVRGRALAIANSFAAGLGAFLWTRLFDRFAFSAGRLRWRHRLAPLYASFFLGPLYCVLLADNLALTLLPGALGAAIGLGRADWGDKRDVYRRTIQLSLWLLACLLCKNSALAWIGGILCALVVLRWKRSGLPAIVAVCAACASLSVGGWVIVRTWLGQLTSHRVLGSVAQYRWTEYVSQAFSSVSRMVGPRRLRIGEMLISAVIVALVAFAVRRTGRAALPVARLIVAVLVFCAVATFLTGVLLAITGLRDTLSDRFVWFLPITIILLLIAIWSEHAFPAGADRVVGLVLVCVVSLNTLYGLRAISARDVPHDRKEVERFIFNDWQIDPAVVNQPPFKRGRSVVVSPPIYPWQER